MIAHFYMKSGNTIEIPDVEDCQIKQNYLGEYTSWSITWKEGKRPFSLISISLPQLEAVVVLPDKE